MWDPQTYLAFEAERTRPARDLLGAVDVGSPARVVDLGCGTGTSTRLLARRWPGAQVLGMDDSAEMIAAAAEAQNPPNVRFARADVAQWQPDEHLDVVFSNALLHWVPAHLELLAGWLDRLGAGGCVAVQVPDSFAEPAHVLLRELCTAPAWRAALARMPARNVLVHSPRTYIDALAAPGRRLDVWQTTYLHRLDGPDPVLRWVSGAALRPVLAALDPAGRERFLAEYGAMLRAAYPPDADGRTTFPFRRLFLVAGPGTGGPRRQSTGARAPE